MADLIDRQALIEWLKKVGRFMKCCENTKRTRETIGGIISHIEKLPAIEAEPVKHGRWEGTADGYADGELVYDMWECSECGYDANGADEKPEWNYCPNCGAKMDLEW